MTLGIPFASAGFDTELAWDVHWNCLGIEGDRFINTDDDFAQAPETTFRVTPEGTLSGGADALAELRQAISQFLDDFIDTLREQTSTAQ